MSGNRDVAIYEELVKIRELLQLLVSENIKEKVEQIATTNERKKVWALSNGENSTADISSKVDISLRAVQIVLKELSDAGLIILERRGYPKRAFNYVPPSWIRGE